MNSYLFLNVYHRPQPSRDFIEGSSQPLSIIGEVDLAPDLLTREGRRVTLPLPTDTSNVPGIHTDIKTSALPLKNAATIVMYSTPIAARK